MASAFADITAAIIERLKAAPAVLPETAIFRASERPAPDSMTEAVNVMWAAANPDAGAIHGAPVDWSTTFVIECYASSKSVSGDLAVDPLFVRIYERLAADTTLGGLVGDLGVPRCIAEFSAEGKKTGWVQMTYIVSHTTNNLNLSS